MIINKIKKKYFKNILPIWLVSLLSTFLLLGCGGSSDNDVGYIQLYNASANSPSIYLTIDQYADDDYDAKTYLSVPFTKTGGRIEYETDTYDIELAWQDQYNDKFDLEPIYENSLQITKDINKFIVVAEDIKNPEIMVYDIPVRDDDEKTDDDDNDVFNIRFLNLHPNDDALNIYISQSDETFNEAILITQSNYTNLSDNQKMEQGDYIVYITLTTNDEILFQSSEISFPYSSEYIMIIRENTGAGASPFIIDRVSTSTATEYADSNAEAEFRVYNAIIEHELLPAYQSSFDFYLNGVDETPEIPSLAFGSFSETIRLDSGDYAMTLLTTNTNEEIIKNHLLALNENSDKTIFFYLLEQDVDADGDGDVDENNDGIVDEIEITINSLVVNNSQSESIYDHQFQVINLIDNDDFTAFYVYFVRNDETIETAEQFLTAIYASPRSISLLNNTYSVYVIGKEDTSEIILASTEITLDEESKDQFMILETDINSPTGYKITLSTQNN